MRWSDREIDYLYKKYSSCSLEKLSKILHRTSNAIYHKASELKLSHLEYNREFMSQKSRKYTIDDTFFDNIDSETKAYFLGLLFADGYNREDKHFVELSLHAKDKDLLCKFNKALSNNKPLFKKIDTRKGRSSVGYVLSFSSKNISRRLALLGCKQRKTLTIRIPKEIELSKYLRSFIRGYFDGDGSIIISYKKFQRYIAAVVKIGVTSNEGFLEGVLKILPPHISQKCCYIIADKRCPGISNLTISGQKRVLDFLDWIYDDATIFLDRKYALYLSLKEAIKRKLRGGELVSAIKN